MFLLDTNTCVQYLRGKNVLVRQRLAACPALARNRLEEMLTNVRGVDDRRTTLSHFSVSHLDVVEAVVLAALDATTPGRLP